MGRKRALLSGELEFLNGDEIFTAGPGDDPHPGVAPEVWGPERYARVSELIGKYGNVLRPEEEEA